MRVDVDGDHMVLAACVGRTRAPRATVARLTRISGREGASQREAPRARRGARGQQLELWRHGYAIDGSRTRDPRVAQSASIPAVSPKSSVDGCATMWWERDRAPHAKNASRKHCDALCAMIASESHSVTSPTRSAGRSRGSRTGARASRGGCCHGSRLACQPFKSLATEYWLGAALFSPGLLSSEVALATCARSSHRRSDLPRCETSSRREHVQGALPVLSSAGSAGSFLSGIDALSRMAK